jgi:hypothetical protein
VRPVLPKLLAFACEALVFTLPEGRVKNQSFAGKGPAELWVFTFWPLPAKLWFLTLPSGRVKTKASQAKAQKGKNQKGKNQKV